MGAFAIGTTIGAGDIMNEVISEDWQSSSPAEIWMWTNPEIDDETLTGLKNIEGVEDVEGLLSTNVEWRLNPTDPWKPAGLIARDDYEDQKYNKLTLIEGDWPSGKTLAME